MGAQFARWIRSIPASANGHQVPAGPSGGHGVKSARRAGGGCRPDPGRSARGTPNAPPTPNARRSLGSPSAIRRSATGASTSRDAGVGRRPGRDHLGPPASDRHDRRDYSPPSGRERGAQERRATKAASELVLTALLPALADADPRLWFHLGRDAIVEIETRRAAGVPWEEIDADVIARGLVARYVAGRRSLGGGRDEDDEEPSGA